MAVPSYNPQHVLHYRSMVDAGNNNSEINALSEPVVVIHSDGENKHTQIKVVPFSYVHVDKAALTFAEKVQYFRKKIRRAALHVGGVNIEVSNVLANTSVVLSQTTDAIDYSDGIIQEMADFNTGFITKPVTDFGGDIDRFFRSHFIDMSPDSLAEVNAEING